MGDEGAAGKLAVAMSAKKKKGEKDPGGLQTLKISNNFVLKGHWNPPKQPSPIAGGNELGTPRKWFKKGTPRKRRELERRYPLLP